MSGQLKDIIKWYQKRVDALQSISLPSPQIEWMIAEIGLSRQKLTELEELLRDAQKTIDSMKRDMDKLRSDRRAGW